MQDQSLVTDQERMEELERYQATARRILALDLEQWKALHETHWLSRMEHDSEMFLSMVRAENTATVIKVWMSQMPEGLMSEVVMGMQAAVLERVASSLVGMTPEEKAKRVREVMAQAQDGLEAIVNPANGSRLQ